MKVTRLGDPQAILNAGTGFNAGTRIPSGGSANQVLTSDGSNGRYWGENVRRITANGSNILLGPDINFIGGAGIGLSASSNSITITAPGGAVGTTASVQFVIDGGGSAITTGVKGYIHVPFGCTITAARLLADQSGSIVVDIWKDTYANYPPVNADSITASAPPTISTAVKSEDTTLTGWTTSISAGDILGYNVDSATTVTRVTVALTVTKT